MAWLGETALRSVKTRMTNAIDIHDEPAKRLVNKYAEKKASKGLQAVRDWYFSGGTRRSFKVISANENRVLIGPTDARANTIVAAQNRACPMWPLSPKDYEAVYAEVRAVLEGNSSMHIIWTQPSAGRFTTEPSRTWRAQFAA